MQMEPEHIIDEQEYLVKDIDFVIRNTPIQSVYDKCLQWLEKGVFLEIREVVKANRPTFIEAQHYERFSASDYGVEGGDVKFYAVKFTQKESDVIVNVVLTSLYKVNRSHAAYWPRYLWELGKSIGAEMDDEVMSRLFPPKNVRYIILEKMFLICTIFVLMVAVLSGKLLFEPLFRVEFGILSVAYFLSAWIFILLRMPFLSKTLR